MHSLYLKPKEHYRIQKGHLWVFSNEIENLPRDIASGETVKLFTHDIFWLSICSPPCLYSWF